MKRSNTTLVIALISGLAGLFGFYRAAGKKSVKNYGEMPDTDPFVMKLDSTSRMTENVLTLLPSTENGLSELEIWALQSEYDSTLNALEESRKEYADSLQDALSDEERTRILDQAGNMLYNTLTGEVFPTWFGTTWDFNGTTNNPQEGEIACGYFVSTTLKHVGFELNRFRIAQQASEIIVKSLCGRDQVVEKRSLQDLLSYARSRKTDLYIIGLDYHVGFLERSADGIFFTHSTYLDPGTVVREKAIDSQALAQSERYVVGSFLSDPRTIQKWLEGTAMPVR